VPYNLGLLLGALFIIFKLLGFVSHWIRGGGGGGSLALVRSAQSNQLENVSLVYSRYFVMEPTRRLS
jgi:hypothetical protein